MKSHINFGSQLDSGPQQIVKNDLVIELYEILTRQGQDGVRAKVIQIRSRPEADQRSLREKLALQSTLDYFRTEAMEDPCGQAATILNIIEKCGLAAAIDRISVAVSRAASQASTGKRWREGGGFWSLDPHGEIRPTSKDDRIAMEEYYN